MPIIESLVLVGAALGLVLPSVDIGLEFVERVSQCQFSQEPQCHILCLTACCGVFCVKIV